MAIKDELGGCLGLILGFIYVICAIDFIGFTISFIVIEGEVAPFMYKIYFFCFLVTVSPLFIIYRRAIADFFVGLFEEKTPPLIYPKGSNVDKKSPVKETPEIPTFNLSGLNLMDLSRELQRTLSSSSSSFIFMRERENRKLELQKEKICYILDIIKDLTLTQQELANFQAETFLSNQLLEAVISGRQQEIINIAEIKKKEFMIKHKFLDDQLSQVEHDKKSRELLIESAELDNLRKKAEINLLTSQTQEAKAKAELIMFVVKELDLKNMPQTLQTYLISSIVNPQGSQYQDFDMQEQLKKFVIKEADAKARQSTAIASTTEQQARIAEKTADKTILDLETIRNSIRR